MIPAYNAEETIATAIESALRQTGSDVEIIVVDDGSTDGTFGAAHDLTAGNDRVTLLSQPNGGTASALNAGILQARGDFVAALGADDELEDTYLETMTGFIARFPDFDIYSHDAWVITPGRPTTRLLGWAGVRSLRLEDLLLECVISGGGTLVRLALLRSLGGYRADMYNEDYDLWLRALAGGARHVYAPYPLYRYNLTSPERKTSNAVKMYESGAEMMEDLIATDRLTPDQRALAQGSADRFRAYLEQTDVYGGATESQLVEAFGEQERAAAQRLLTWVMPRPMADAALARIHRFAWLVRPLRKAIWRARLSQHRGAPRHADAAWQAEPDSVVKRVAIVIPAYNAGATIAETLDSVCAQTSTDWECVVVDDGSTDDTSAVAQRYASRDERIRVVSQPNRGTGGAYNTGIRATSAPWICICSADDLLLPSHLQVVSRSILEHPEADIFSSNGYFLDLDGSRKLVYEPDAGSAPASWTLSDLFARCFFSVGACYRRSVFESLGGYAEEAYGEDYDLWLRALARGARHRYIPEALAVHRLSPTQKSAAVVRAFRSDIRSIRGVLASAPITPHERIAACTAIWQRRWLVAQIEAPTSLPVRALTRLLLLLERLRP